MKKETKEKLENFWYYNKIAVLLGFVGLIFVAFASLSFFVNTESDLKITMLTSVQQEEFALSLKPLLMEHLEDINGDNYIEVGVRDMLLNNELDAENSANVQKSILSQMANRGATLFIFDKANYDLMVQKDAFCPLDQIISLEGLEDRVVYRNDIPVAVSLAGSKMVKEAGAVTEELYALVLFRRPEDAGNEKIDKEYENAKIALEVLLAQ
ncbi:MAG: hypothetical protein IJO50_02295 [Clostridia bacterium]|nr:hypothetical protein [Clostridia bacterium]